MTSSSAHSSAGQQPPDDGPYRPGHAASSTPGPRPHRRTARGTKRTPKTKRAAVLTLCGLAAEIIGQTIGRIPWMPSMGGHYSAASNNSLCQQAHAMIVQEFGDQWRHTTMCTQAADVMDLAVFLNVAGFVALAVAAVRWYRGHQAARADAPLS